MRLTEEQRRAIREAVVENFGVNARVLLFGSRTDDTRRGGDIDLLVEAQGVTSDSSAAMDLKFRTIAAIQRRIGERKIDLIVADPDSTSSIVSVARREGVAI